MKGEGTGKGNTGKGKGSDCWACGGKGHYQRECPSIKGKGKGKGKDVNAIGEERAEQEVQYEAHESEDWDETYPSMAFVGDDDGCTDDTTWTLRKNN